MKKILLKGMAFALCLGSLYASDGTVQEITQPIVVEPGNTVILENADRYEITNSITLNAGEADEKATLIAKKPVTIKSGNTGQGFLKIGDISESIFEDTLTIEDGGYLDTTVSSGDINVKLTVMGRLTCNGNGDFRYNEDKKPKIDLYKKDGERNAIFDVSRANSSIVGFIFDGHNQSFLECYNATMADTNANLLPTLDGLATYNPESGINKTSVIDSVRDCINGVVDTIYFANMKIQDYISKAGTTTVTVNSGTKEVKAELTGAEFLIASDNTTKEKVDNKEGLTLVRADCTGIIDFYTKFNTDTGDGIPNASSNKFVEWTDEVQLPLSNGTSTNTDFDFLLDFAPSAGKERDIHLTGGEKNIETVMFTGNNSAFNNKAVLYNSLKNVEFGSGNGAVALDVTNVYDNNISLTVQDTTSNVKTNTFYQPVVARDDQKVSLNVGNYDKVVLSSKDASEKVYKFNNLTMGSNSSIEVGVKASTGVEAVTGVTLVL